MKALFPGSFNPFTTGHLDILCRALRIFDKVVLAVGYNDKKQADMVKAAETLRELFADVDRVEVILYSGLTVEAVATHDCDVMLRGFRNSIDAEYERTLADTNRLISGIDTFLLPTRPDLACVSSSTVRELLCHGFDVSAFVPTRRQCYQACIEAYK